MARPNMKRLFASSKLKVGHILFEFSTPGIGQILKAANVDFVFVDMEHSGFGISEIKRIITSLRAAEHALAGSPTIEKLPSYCTSS